MTASFDRIGPIPPLSPVIVSVPHAGRDYPLPLRAAAAVPIASMLALEDRHADTLALAARGAETLFVQRLARAWVDLNRGEDERDPLIDEGAAPIPPGATAVKLRSGLGLIPRRAAPGVTLWRRRLGDDEVRQRIVDDYRPYHAAIADALLAARDRFGSALLIDFHSMPPLPGGGAARIVFGDRFGRSAGAQLVHRLEAEAAMAGYRTGLNAPYPGGHILTRHGRPGQGVHAIQIEVDRRLYLDAGLNMPGKGLGATAALLRRLIDAATDELLGASEAIAAE